jgi:hypothetical protein
MSAHGLFSWLALIFIRWQCSTALVCLSKIRSGEGSSLEPLDSYVIIRFDRENLGITRFLSLGDEVELFEYFYFINYLIMMLDSIRRCCHEQLFVTFRLVYPKLKETNKYDTKSSH